MILLHVSLLGQACDSHNDRIRNEIFHGTYCMVQLNSGPNAALLSLCAKNGTSAPSKDKLEGHLDIARTTCASNLTDKGITHRHGILLQSALLLKEGKVSGELIKALPIM